MFRRPGPGADFGRRESINELRGAIGRSGTSRRDDYFTSQWPLLELAETLAVVETMMELDVPIFVHPALVPTGYEHLKVMICRGFWAGKLILQGRTRLIAGGLFDRFPEPENGGGIAAVQGPPRRQGYRFGTLPLGVAMHFEKHGPPSTTRARHQQGSPTRLY